MPEHAYFDVTAAFPMYSTLAGVLAAFAFAAIVWVLDNGQDRLPQAARRAITSSLLTVFLGMLVSSFVYAELCGEKRSAGDRVAIVGLDSASSAQQAEPSASGVTVDDFDRRLASMVCAAALIFAATSVLMFWTITLLIHEQDEQKQLGIDIWLFLVAQDFVLLMVAGAVFDDSTAVGIYGAEWPVWVTCSAALAFQLTCFAWSRWTSRPFDENRYHAGLARVPSINLAVMVVGIVWFSVTAMDVNYHRTWLYGGALGLASVVLLCLLSFHYSLTMSPWFRRRGSEDDAAAVKA